MSKDEVAAYLKRVESHDSPLYSPQAGAGFASNWRSGAYFKDTVVNILKNRFGDDWNIWKVQWPSYKIAIDGFLNNNPFYMFFPWDSANSAGKNQNDTDEIKGYVEGYFIVLARIIIEKIQNKTELHPAEQNFINGIIAYARGKTTNLTPVSRAKGSGKEEAGVPFSVAPFPLWQLPHDKKDPNDWEHFPVVGGRPSDLYGGAEYLGFGPSDVKDMLLKNSYDLNETGGKDDPPILDSIIQAIAFNEQWDILRQGGAAEDYVTGMYDNQYFGYTGILKKVTRDVGKLIKNHEEMPVDMKTVGARYFPYKKFPRNNTGPNVYLKKHWVIGRDLYDYTTEDPPGIPIDAFNLAVGADSNVSPSADIFNWAGDSGRGTLYKDAKYVAETRASGSQEIQHPLVQIYQEIYDFPKDILGTPGMDKWMEDLKEFGKFEGGKDITQYPFQYIPNSKVANTGAGGALEFWATWWAGEKEVSEQQRIKALIQGGWARMVIRGFNSEAFQTTVDEAYADLFNNNFLRNIYSSILKDKEVARRFSLFKYYVELSKELKDRPEDKQYIGSVAGDIEDANLEANDAWEEGTPPPPPVKKSKFGDAEDIEKRQKFFKQCALLLNMGELGSKLRAEIRSGASRHEKLPFGGRFWMMKCSENQEKLMGNLISPEDGKEFFNIPPSVVSYLTPKFRLFKVENEKEKGNLQETEFIFPAFTDINRKTNYKKKQNIQSLAIKPFLGNDFDKGDGFGLKEFSFEFNGTNPAESRNDIKATLKLYFQSFADFIRERVSTNGKTYRFVDLVIQPNPDSNSVNGVEIVHPNQYDPSFYRLRAEIGYNYPDNMSEFYDDPKGVLKKAINRTNRSYFLCMVDHDLDIDIDGTVTLSISYRAYVESLLKTLRFDALSSPELIRSQRDHRKKWESILNGKECSEDQLQEIKRAMSVKEDSLRKQTLRSIVSRLLADGKVYVTEVDPNHATDFRDYGTFFNGCDLNELTSGYSTVPSPSSEFPGGTAGFILQGDLPKNYDYRDINDVSVQYFFFGDLLYTIMDSMMDLDDKDKMAAGCENTKFILGSFDFVPYVNGKHSSLGMNIAEIPIALDYFMKWFTDNVITQGETRKSFPILTFIRNLVNNLLQKSLLETCVNKDLSKELRFQTGQVSAYHKGSDPLAPYYARDTKSGIFGNLVLDTDAAREQGLLPLAGDAESGNSSINNKINNFHNYLVLSTYGSTLTYTGKGKYKDDVKFGRYHIDIGSNKGIVKKVSFKKTDMQYIREARFFQQGIDGLLQLSNVYNISVEMFGNTLFYPGMELFLNPYGIGGTGLGSSTQGPNHEGGRSMANILGLGGYHTITNVKTSLTPGNFTTNIEAYQYYSGDGTGNPNLNGKPMKRKSADDAAIEKSAATARTEKCATLTRDMHKENYNFLSNHGDTSLRQGEAKFVPPPIEGAPSGGGDPAPPPPPDPKYKYATSGTEGDGNVYFFMFVPTTEPSDSDTLTDFTAEDRIKDATKLTYTKVVDEGLDAAPSGMEILGLQMEQVKTLNYFLNDNPDAEFSIEMYYNANTCYHSKLFDKSGSQISSTYGSTANQLAYTEEEQYDTALEQARNEGGE